MAQRPVLTAETTANARDFVSREVFRKDYDALSGGVKTDFDRVGDDAFMHVTNMWRWYAEVDPSAADLPSDFNEVFRVTWVWKALRYFRSSEDARQYQNDYLLPVESRLADTFTNNWSAGSFLVDDDLTPRKMRNAAIARLVKQRTPVYPPITEVDRVIRSEFVKLWEYHRWSWVTKLYKVTIDTSNNVTIDGSDRFDGFASQEIQLSDGKTVVWADSTQVLSIAKKYDGKTGRPQFFYDEDAGETKNIIFLPTPDQSYTGFATIYRGVPALPGIDDTGGISEMPRVFRYHLLESIVAELMRIHGRENNDIQAALKRVDDERIALTSQWDDKGASRSAARPHHHTRLISELTSYTGSNTIEPY